MDTQFTFPPPQKPIPRPAGRSASAGSSGPRESNALRASVLDAALELGLVSNAGWMFDNALKEENEDEDQTPSPGLTYGSSVTSEESIPSILSPSSSEAHANGTAPFARAPSSHQYHNHHFPPSAQANGYAGGSAPPVPGAQRKDPVVRIIEPGFHARLLPPPAGEQVGGVAFPEGSGAGVPVRPTTPAGGRKLTKKKRAGDGYESDGGYMSEAGKKKEKKKDKDKDKEKKGDMGLAAAATEDMEALGLVETSKEAKKRAKEEKKEAEAERKRTKSLLSAAKAARKASAKDGGGRDGGYETDGGSSSKSKSKSSSKKSSAAEASGYETDGTPAKKAKSRFFKLGSRTSSKTDLRADAQAVPPLPFPAPREQDKESVPLPIAERFATTLGPSFFSAPTSPSSAEGRVTPLLNQAAAPSPSLHSLASQGLGASAASGGGSPISPGRNLTAAPAAVPPPSAPGNRNSQMSAVSSTSSGSRSRAHTEGSTSKHHGTDSGTSYSTITSSSIITSSAHQHQPPPVMPPLSSSSSSQPLPSSAGPRPGVGTGLRPPAVSFSASRSPSPSRAPPVTPLSVKKGPGLRLKASLDTLIGARNATPSPISPAPLSPYVMVPTPSPSNLPSPMTGVGMPPSPAPGKLRNSSADGAEAGFRVGGGFGFRAKSPSAPSPRAVISSPNTAIGVANAAAAAAAAPTAAATPITGVTANNGSTSNNLSINTGITNTFSPPVNVESPTYLNVVPSSQYLVPSPRNSSLPSPNVLAYYDLPPPSPAPQGPLPIPPLAGAPAALNSRANSIHMQTHLPSPAALRQRVIDRTPRALPPELSAALHGQATVQRGRESPFPARPILPVASVQQPAAPGPGLEARMATRRYRELYAPLPVGNASGVVDMERYQEEKEQAMERRRARLAGERERSWIVDAEDGEEGGRMQEDYYSAEDDYDEHEGDSQELRGVLDRFAPEDTNSSEGHETGRALGRRRSFDAIQARVGPAGAFEFEDDGRTMGDRMSRWSGSIYSRSSILDADESGETRERLVKQVEAMLDAERRDGGAGVEGTRGYVPPVPRLPAAYANMSAQVNTALPGRSWNRF